MKESELLQELARELTIPAIEANEITARQVAEYSGVGYDKAVRHLKNKAAAGELVFRRVRMPDGKIALAYRKA